MDNLESKIMDILKRGTPLRAAKIAEMLGVERREVNHYLYSSLKHLVIQDSDYKWSLNANKTSNNQPITPQTNKPQTPSSIPIKQDTSYRFIKKDIKQDTPIQPPISSTPPSQPIKQNNPNPFNVVRKELAQVSPEEKVKILENSFRQDRFSDLEVEQINALQSILEEARREVSIANSAYRQGKLSFWKANSVAIAVLSIAVTLGTLFVMNQLRVNSIFQPTPTLPKSK